MPANDRTDQTKQEALHENVTSLDMHKHAATFIVYSDNCMVRFRAKESAALPAARFCVLSCSSFEDAKRAREHEDGNMLASDEC